VGDVELVAYCGRDAAKASAMAQRYGGTAYRELDAFLAHRPMDVVVVGTPSGVHAEHAQAAARQGLHVLVEKPLDITTARIDGLTAECDRAGVKLGVIYQDRAAPDLIWLKRLIARGGLGRPIVASARVRSVELRAALEAPAHDGEPSGNASASSPVVADARGHARVLQDFVAAITSGAAPLCDGREGRRSVALVEAMYRSARAGAPVIVAEREGALDALER